MRAIQKQDSKPGSEGCAWQSVWLQWIATGQKIFGCANSSISIDVSLSLQAFLDGHQMFQDQRKTCRKSKTIYSRLHEINEYHRKTIYQLQNPKNFEGSNNWMNRNRYVRKPGKIRDNEDNLDIRDELVLSESETSESLKRLRES